MRHTSYVLPMRWNDPGPLAELAAYLERIAEAVDEVIVVDGSPDELFERHRRGFGETVTHIRPDPALHFGNGKVDGVVTGVRRARNEFVVIADDDVRYGLSELTRLAETLRRCDLVRPQNYFRPWVWHALWDAPRSLINRVHTGDHEFPRGDFPGTFGIRRSTFLAAGGYDGDTLFENLELMRTVLAAGGKVVTPLDLFVARTPPSARHFLSQRVRQAYDDQAMPIRAAAFLAILPTGLLLRGVRRRWFLGLVAFASIVLAEQGRWSGGAARHFPVTTSVFAPVWTAERAVCSWLALFAAFRGGAKYGDRRLRKAANPTGRLRREMSAGAMGDGAGEPGREISSTVR